MPKATHGGVSNGWEPGAPEPAELPPPPPASAPKAEHAAYAAAALGVPEEEAAAMTKPELVELARPAATPRRDPATTE